MTKIELSEIDKIHSDAISGIRAILIKHKITTQNEWNDMMSEAHEKRIDREKAKQRK